jgi:hypothetical protein
VADYSPATFSFHLRESAIHDLLRVENPVIEPLLSKGPFKHAEAPDGTVWGSLAHVDFSDGQLRVLRCFPRQPSPTTASAMRQSSSPRPSPHISGNNRCL